MGAQYGFTELSATGRYAISPSKLNNDNIVSLTVGSSSDPWTITGTLQGNPFTEEQDPDGLGWQNIASVRSDTMAIEQTPTLTANTARSWKADCSQFAQVAFNVTVISGTCPFNLQTYYQENGLGFNQVAPYTTTSFSGAITPASNDGAAIGSASLGWSDLFLAEGAVINWDNGDVTITQTNNVLAIAGTTSTTFDGQVNPATNDAASLGTTALGWSDLHLATGGVINWANGEVTITEEDANTLTVAGATAVKLGAVTLNVTGTRITQSYHTNITSTNAVTVDSSETVKRDIAPYQGDALSILRDVRVATYRHNDHLDSGAPKLGMIAESVREPLALDKVGEGAKAYPGINTYGLAALQTRAIQQLSERLERLEQRN